MYNSDLPTRAELPTTNQLLKSTAIAMAVAGALLVTVVLPAEYGVDPTGIGRVLGLKEMGEIKQQLAEEAATDAEQTAVASPAESAPEVVARVPEEVAAPEATQPEAAASDVWKDEMTLTLNPGDAAEIKLTMAEAGIATYEWVTDQGHLNSDLHGDGPGGKFISYRKGRFETGDSGEFAADFEGVHGWFWRNRSEVPVTVTLRTKGAYSDVKRVM